MAGYLLDTNIISETRKVRANSGVTKFLAEADSQSLFISALTIGELVKGIAIKRKTDPSAADMLTAWVGTLESTFADRILVVDLQICRLWGVLSAPRSLPVVDTLMAATALVHGFTLVTRNTKDFAATGAVILDPWT